jgi:hypothetical protein
VKGPAEAQVSVLLQAWSNGDPKRVAQAAPPSFTRSCGDWRVSTRSAHGLQTTALLNEAYLKLADCKRIRSGEPGALFRSLCTVDETHSRGSRPADQARRRDCACLAG